jgi:hypothetical protein
VAFFVFASSATAVVLINDTWRDDTDTDPASPTYSEMGTDADADGDLESAWYQGGAGSLNPVAGGGPGPQRGDLGAGGTGSGSWTTYFTPEATPVTLSGPGSNMRLTWRFTLGNVGAANTSQNFRFAVVDTPSAARLVANGSPGVAAYTGYAIFGNMGVSPLGNTNPFALRERVVASGNMLSAAADWGANGVANGTLANGATTGNAGYANNTTYTLNWLMTRTSLGGLEHRITMTGGTLNNTGTASITFTDATPNSFVYDTFSLRPSSAVGTAQIFDTSLFRIETNVPELASVVGWALIGLTVCCCAGVRRWYIAGTAAARVENV